MSTVFETLPGEYHISIRIRGHRTLENLTLFHALMCAVDRDWPWKSKNPTSIRVCTHCCGVLVNAPRFSPADLKAAGRQCGLKVKVYKFSRLAMCYTPTQQYSSCVVLPYEDSALLYSYRPSQLELRSGRLYQISGGDASKRAKANRVATKLLGAEAAKPMLVN